MRNQSVRVNLIGQGRILSIVTAALMVASSTIFAPLAAATMSTQGMLAAPSLNSGASAGSSPVGYLDGVAPTTSGRIEISGWAADPTLPGSRIQVHVYVTGPNGNRRGTSGIYTGEQRLDIAATYPWAGSKQGFRATVPNSGIGDNLVCAYAIDVTPPLANPGIGCKTVNIADPRQPPVGNVDSVVVQGNSAVISGWTFDPKQPNASIRLHIDTYTGSAKKVNNFVANGSRPDVNRAFGISGLHGFSEVVELVEGSNTVCVHGIGTNQDEAYIGCYAVKIEPTSSPVWGEPVWRDEFDYRDDRGQPMPDPAKWDIKDRSTFGLLNDASVISRDQVTNDSQGILHIRADWLATPIASSTGPMGDRTQRWHKTGYLDHRLPGGGHIFAQQFGRWEIRAKVPTGANTLGALAAFWLRNNDSGEIDIMESWGVGARPLPSQKPGTSTTTIHSNTMGGGEKKAWTIEDEVGKKGVSSEDVSAGFHVWAFELTPSYAAGFKDGLEVFRTTPGETPMLWGSSFRSPLHMRLNLHVGPSAQYWGLPDPKDRGQTAPLDFQVDYIRVYAVKN